MYTSKVKAASNPQPLEWERWCFVCPAVPSTVCFTPAPKPEISGGVRSFSNLKSSCHSDWLGTPWFLYRVGRMVADWHIMFCSYCPRRHTGRNLQPSETDHRGTVWALHLDSSKGKIMKTDFYFSFSNWHHLLHLTTLKPFQWSLPLVLSSVVHTLTITFCSSHNALHLVSLLV